MVASSGWRWSPVPTVSAFLTVGSSHEKAHGWEGTNRGYHSWSLAAGDRIIVAPYRHERGPLMEINSSAPVISRHEIAINAPLESVWLVHTEIDFWPQWNPDIAKAHLTGPIAVGTVFRWETAGMAIPSTIGEVVPLKKLARNGETGGILGIHVWNFWAIAEGTHVRTEESWEGP
jgi:hypothetical protein